MSEKELSNEGKWFLKNLQKIQDNFAEDIGAQIVTTDKEGNLVTEMSGQQEVCQIIQKTEKGKQGCQEAYQTALSLVKTMKEPAFMDCHAGLASLWIPIKVKGEIVGSVTGCGGRYDRGESEEELKKKFRAKAEELGIGEEDMDKYLEAVAKVKVTTEEEMKKRADRLSKLVGVLAEETALKEVFGT